MIVSITDDFNLDRIADSGQCFRWHKTGERAYRIIAGEACLTISSQGENRYELDCTERDFDEFWRDYFDLREDYRSIRRRVDPGQDPFLCQAMEHEKGIRILRQDPWEMLITFIISQNKNIPMIRRSVELLSECCGRKLTDSKGQEYFGFPEPAAVAALSEEDLAACRLGYGRDEHLVTLDAARADGPADIGFVEVRRRRVDVAAAARERESNSQIGRAHV